MVLLPLKQSFLLVLQTIQVHTIIIRVSASTLAAVIAEVRGMGAEIRNCYKENL